MKITQSWLIKISEVATDANLPDKRSSLGVRTISYDYDRQKFKEPNCKDGNKCQKAFGLQGAASNKERFCKRYKEYRNKCPATCGLCEGILYDI